MARSSLAPKLRSILADSLQKAVNPDGDDERADSIADIKHGLKELNRVRERCDEADEMYDGDVGMVYASSAVKRMLVRQGVEDIPDFNYSHIPVDAIAKRLAISSVVAGPDEENDDDSATQDAESAQVKAATKAIAKLRKDNELDAEEKRLHHSASKHGDAYLLVWPGQDLDGKPTVDMRVNSAHHVILIYDEEDPLRPAYALKSWDTEIDGQACVRANLYYTDRIERWVTQPGGTPDKDDDWVKIDDDDLDTGEMDDDEQVDALEDEFVEQDDHGDPVPASRSLMPGEIANPHGRIPWFHFRNHRPEGIPEHRNAYGPQTLINKIVFALAAGVDFNSLKQKYLLVDPSQDDPLVNLVDPDHPDDDEDDPENTGGTSGLRNEPGEIWRLHGKSVGEFSAADLGGLLSILDRIVKSMAELTGLPQWAFSRTAGDMPSGESVRELNGDLNATVQDRIDRYDPMWQDAYEFALKLLGITGVAVDVRWAPIERVNDTAGWQVVQAKITAGVPPEVALGETGYAPEQVKEWLADAKGADLGRRVALLGQIGTAVQSIGAGIALGAVSKEQVQALIAGVLGLTMEGTDVDLPDPSKLDDFVDPQQQKLDAMAAMQDATLGHQAEQNQAQREHATATQQASQDHQRNMAVEAHQRAQEMMDRQAGAQAQQNRQSGSKGSGGSGSTEGRKPQGGPRRPGSR